MPGLLVRGHHHGLFVRARITIRERAADQPALAPGDPAVLAQSAAEDQRELLGDPERGVEAKARAGAGDIADRAGRADDLAGAVVEFDNAGAQRVMSDCGAMLAHDGTSSCGDVDRTQPVSPDLDTADFFLNS